MEPSADLKGRLFDLKQRFVQRMPARIAAVAAALSECGQGGVDATERLERQFHTLAGTAGTYDLGAVYAAAREGEEVCAEHKQGPLDKDTTAYLLYLVDQLRGALAVDAPAQWTSKTILVAADSVAVEKKGIIGA